MLLLEQMAATALRRQPQRIRGIPPVCSVAVPPLENRDSLTAGEFLRRYEASPRVKKAELINGLVHMPSPVRIGLHGKPDGIIQTWVGVYAASTPGTTHAPNTTVCIDPDNVPQPDALLMIDPDCGGAARIGEDDYVHGPPEFVAEVAGSSAGIDLREKLHAYRRAGVKEYLVWRTADAACDWFVREGDDFVPLAPSSDGLIWSRVFPGLVLNPKALIERNAAAVLASLQKGLNKPAHKKFVARLKAGTRGR